jgi:hypothetical protein
MKYSIESGTRQRLCRVYDPLSLSVEASGDIHVSDSAVSGGFFHIQ